MKPSNIWVDDLEIAFDKSTYEIYPWLNRANQRRMIKEGWIVDDDDGDIRPFDRMVNQYGWKSKLKRSPFQTNQQALDFVKRRADKGSEFHKNALAVATQIKVKGSF